MNDMPSAPPSRSGRAFWAAGAALGLLALGVAWKWWPGRDAPQPETGPTPAAAVDPRLTFPTPYRNVHPAVKYVGDEACADCHLDKVLSYREHPMGRALAPVASATPIERDGPAAHNPFVARGLHYDVRRRDDRVWHRERVADPDGRALAEVEAEVLFAVGSGARARSYLVGRDGYLFQSPITWFPQAGRWDLSPGYENRNLHFGRPVMPACLFCHCNHAEHVPLTVNRYRPPVFRGHTIGCERCHGPGELHVRRREARGRVDGPDDTIVNPARLEHALREAVCQQCHVQGEQRVLCRGRSDFDYRPGLPLHLFVMDFVDKRNQTGDVKFVNSVEQVMASRCYRASRGPKKLGCISCHDPHYHPAPEAKVAHYRDRCLRCHTEASCSLPPAVRRQRNREDSCIACHMPPTGSEVNHTSITDHRILRRAQGPAPAPGAKRTPPGPSDLVPFHRDLLGPADEEAPRNLGVALMGMLGLAPPADIKRQFAEKALPLLDRALERDGSDWPAREARGVALWSLGRRDEAMTDLGAVLTVRPRSESTLHAAGNLALDLDRPGAARSYFERAAAVNPWRWHYHHGQAVASFRQKEWERAARECRQSLRLGPANAASRSLLVQCLLCLGRGDEAGTEFEALWQLTPEGRRPELRRWFDEVRWRFLPARP